MQLNDCRLHETVWAQWCLGETLMMQNDGMCKMMLSQNSHDVPASWMSWDSAILYVVFSFVAILIFFRTLLINKVEKSRAN